MATTPFTLYEYTDQLTRQEDGSFRWRCDIEKEYEQRTYKTTMIICAAIAAFILVFGGFLAVMYDDLTSFAIVAGCVAVFLLISLLTCWGLNKLPEDKEGDRHQKICRTQGPLRRTSCLCPRAGYVFCTGLHPQPGAWRSSNQV